VVAVAAQVSPGVHVPGASGGRRLGDQRAHPQPLRPPPAATLAHPRGRGWEGRRERRRGEGEEGQASAAANAKLHKWLRVVASGAAEWGPLAHVRAGAVEGGVHKVGRRGTALLCRLLGTT